VQTVLKEGHIQTEKRDPI